MPPFSVALSVATFQWRWWEYGLVSLTAVYKKRSLAVAVHRGAVGVRQTSFVGNKSALGGYERAWKGGVR